MPIRGGNLKPQVGKEMNAQENESSVIYLKFKKKQIQTNSLVSQHRKFPSLSIYGGLLIVLTSVLVLLMTFQK